MTMIAISQNAANQIHKMLAKNGLEGGGLRVGIKAGGCSGYEYIFAWEKDPRATDGVFVGPGRRPDFRRSEELRPAARHRARLRHEPDEPRFQFNNPNAKSTCGCGFRSTPDGSNRA